MLVDVICGLGRRFAPAKAIAKRFESRVETVVLAKPGKIEHGCGLWYDNPFFHF
jgi:hypothetical protein